jgi:hypothetical protein
VGLGRLLGRIDRLAGRFNKWFGPAALASNTRNTDKAGTADPGHVVAILGEIERQGQEANKDT